MQTGIDPGGEHRLRAAIRVEVRKEHQGELSAATKNWQRLAIEEKIEQEIEDRMKRLASSYSLWSSR